MNLGQAGIFVVVCAVGCGGARSSDGPERADTETEKAEANPDHETERRGPADDVEPADRDDDTERNDADDTERNDTDDGDDKDRDDVADDARPGAEPDAADDAAGSEPAAESEEPTGASEPTRPTPLLGLGELTIPMVPSTIASAPVYFAGPDPGVPLETSLSFALDEEYPRTVEVVVEGLLLPDGRAPLRLTSLDLEGTAVDARLLEGGTFELDLVSEGDAIARVAGERSSDEGTTSFAAEIAIAVRRVGAVKLGGCAADGGPALSGLPITLTWLEVYDTEGARLIPANATSGRAATVTLRASTDTALRAEDGLSTLVATGAEQFVQVSSAWGDVGRFELVGPERVDSMNAWFSLNASWTRGLTLESGGRQSVSFDDPGRIRIAPNLYVEGRSLCADLSPDWFAVDSETPEVCPTAAIESVGGTFSLPRGALAAAPGHCELQVTAPMFGDGTVETRLSIEFLEF